MNILGNGQRKICFWKLVFILLLIVFTASCGSTPIGKILSNPRDYNNQEVKLSGTVKESVSVIFMKYFILKDDSGEIFVVTERPLPRIGDSVTVKGKAQEAFAIGDKRLVVIVEATI